MNCFCNSADALPIVRVIIEGPLVAKASRSEDIGGGRAVELAVGCRDEKVLEISGGEPPRVGINVLEGPLVALALTEAGLFRRDLNVSEALESDDFSRVWLLLYAD